MYVDVNSIPNNAATPYNRRNKDALTGIFEDCDLFLFHVPI